MLSDNVKDRLENWKFYQAIAALDHDDDPSEPTTYEREAIRALADLVGNSGWFDGSLGIVVGSLVDALVGADLGAER